MATRKGSKATQFTKGSTHAKVQGAKGGRRSPSTGKASKTSKSK